MNKEAFMYYVVVGDKQEEMSVYPCENPEMVLELLTTNKNLPVHIIKGVITTVDHINLVIDVMKNSETELHIANRRA
jgi:hypothetical protein